VLLEDFETRLQRAEVGADLPTRGNLRQKARLMKKWKTIRSDQIVRDRNGAPSLDETEEIESTFMAATEIRAAIGQGQFSQATHIASFYMGVEALEHRTQVRL
jgi:hypothetical protein